VKNLSYYLISRPLIASVCRSGRQLGDARNQKMPTITIPSFYNTVISDVNTVFVTSDWRKFIRNC